ncbi:hypothetical protein [Bacillus mycoides]|uniref:hypothetical protein n=1 Tax=Bacillus mycoides TaxID=1405 RepID=UPI002E214A0C|nr:hypothetical protein [Bacillus mycoides]
MNDLRIWYDSLPSEGKHVFKLCFIVLGLIVAGIFNLSSPVAAPFSFFVIALASIIFIFYTPKTYEEILTTILIAIGVSVVIFAAVHDNFISNLANSLSLWGLAFTLLVIIIKKSKADTKLQEEEPFHSVDIKNRLEAWINSDDWKSMDRSKAKEMRQMLYKLRIPEYDFEPQYPDDELSDEEKKKLDESM